jgi:hypothetical protein
MICPHCGKFFQSDVEEFIEKDDPEIYKLGWQNIARQLKEKFGMYRMAKLLEMDKGTISKWFSGKTKWVQENTRLKLYIAYKKYIVNQEKEEVYVPPKRRKRN